MNNDNIRWPAEGIGPVMSSARECILIRLQCESTRYSQCAFKVQLYPSKDLTH